MQQLMQQNNRLRQIMQKCQQQILQLRKIGQQHEQQIDNLLKFNQRLLSIIQAQMPNKTISRSPSGGNLQPIDEAAGDKEQQLGVGNNNISSTSNGNSNFIGLVNNHRFASMQLEKHQAIRERVEHLEEQQVEHLSQQQNNYTHHLNNDNHQNQYKSNDYQHQQQQQHQQNHISNIPINNKKELKFITTQSYSPRTNNQQQQQNRYDYQQQQQYDQQQEERDNVIYRQEKESLIDIPKFFKLQKGLSQHYHKELFHSIEQHNNMNSNNNRNYLNVNHNHLNNITSNNSLNNNSKPPQLRKLSIPSQASQLMGKISQAQTQRITQIMNEQQLTKQLNQIKSLIHQYRDDFNLQQCLHLCDIIKQDLENDLDEIKEGNKQRLRVMESKERQCRGLKERIRGFSGVDNLVEIMKRLDVSQSTQYLVMQRITGGNIKNSQNSNNSNNINSMSNVSIMARNR